MPQTDWQNLSKSGDMKRRNDASTEPKSETKVRRTSTRKPKGKTNA